MGQETKVIEPNEPIFELREVAGPDFALKQQGDTKRVATRLSSSASNPDASRS